MKSAVFAEVDAAIVFVDAKNEGPCYCRVNEREGQSVGYKGRVAATTRLVPLIPEPATGPEEAEQDKDDACTHQSQLHWLEIVQC